MGKGLRSCGRSCCGGKGTSEGLPASVIRGGIHSLLGFVFNCPDLIGGGLGKSFMPIVELSHGPRNFRNPSRKTTCQFAEPHSKLRPSLLKPLVARAVENDKPIWSPLFYASPEDEKVYLVGDEFVVRDSLLAAPVLGEGARAGDIYLPAGKWRDYWSGKIVTGGRTIKSLPAPLDTIPVFERAGRTVPGRAD